MVYVDLDASNGIKPHPGFTSRRKYYVVLGFSEDCVLVGGVVFNSHINFRLPETIRMYHYPVKHDSYSFLTHDSFIDCASFIPASFGKLNSGNVVGRLIHEDLVMVINSVKECPVIPYGVKKYYGLL